MEGYRRPARPLAPTVVDPVAYIPNFNGRERLARALESLAAQSEPCKVVVVDNGSTDGSAEMMRDRFPRVELMLLERNVGFGVALNQAIEAFPGDPLLLLNNDVVCAPDFVAEMLASLRPDVEMVAGVLLQDRAPELVDSAGIIVDERTLMAFDYLHGHPAESVKGAAAPVGPSGGGALYRHQPFLEVGGFDEHIFAYYEDLDLALRLRAAGGRCALAPGARARHAYSATLRGRPGAKYALTGWSRGYMLRRYGVLKRPSSAARTLLIETTICAGQVVLDRTLKGAAGRLRGWRDAAGLSRRPLPDGLGKVSLRAALGRRLRRHLGMSLRDPV
jgi:GT2 family glycosyltransferase